MSRSDDNVVMEITPQVLLKAYACGIFPMAESADDPGLHWIEPVRRGILPLDKVHVPRRLKKTIRAKKFDIRIDTDFQAVIDGCAAPGAGRQKTWINKRIRKLYGDLYEMGNCHTVEAWLDGNLVGGLYGISLCGAFYGESMFARERDASKVALTHLVGRLIAGGFELLDTQFVTDHLTTFGAVEIPKSVYTDLLDSSLKHQGDFFALPENVTGGELLNIIEKYQAD
ncbi:MAG: leucyl/phenylalanyl-tRNA--protein transferase [Stappiaceae bacterium]